jgi:hypothetical protein
VPPDTKVRDTQENYLATFISSAANNLQPEDYFAHVYNWLRNRFPPKMLQEDLGRLKRLGNNSFHVDDKQRLLTWISTVEQNVNFQDDSLKKVFKRFGSILLQFREHLLAN